MTLEREAVLGRPWPDRYTFLPALPVGDTVYISGRPERTRAARITAPSDIEEQTRQIFRKFEALLGSLGSSCDAIVSTTDLAMATQGYQRTALVRREFVRNGFPTATGVIVTGLLRKDVL